MKQFSNQHGVTYQNQPEQNKQKIQEKLTKLFESHHQQEQENRYKGEGGSKWQWIQAPHHPNRKIRKNKAFQNVPKLLSATPGQTRYLMEQNTHIKMSYNNIGRHTFTNN